MNIFQYLQKTPTLNKWRYLANFTLLYLLLGSIGIQPAWADFKVTVGPNWTFQKFDYAPSIIEKNGVRKIWWCGSQAVTGDDMIYYRELNLTTGEYSPIRDALLPTRGAWDGKWVCDPSVVQGNYGINPVNNQPFIYAMYYTGVNSSPGVNNQIGVAFSSDGLQWTKMAMPIISPIKMNNSYGAGQPSAFKFNTGKGTWLFYTDASNSDYSRIYLAKSENGIDFVDPSGRPDRTLISNRVDESLYRDSAGNNIFQYMANSDFAFDSSTGTFYATIPLPGRANVPNPPLPPNIGDRETYQFGLYRMPVGNLVAGSGTWETLGVVSTNLDSAYLNHSPGLRRDEYGNLDTWLNGSDHSVMAYFTVGMNDPATWEMVIATWTPSSTASPTLPLNRYVSIINFGTAPYHVITTGSVQSGYRSEGNLGYIFAMPQAGTKQLYGCQDNINSDRFVSLDFDCGNNGGKKYLSLGSNGWIYNNNAPGRQPIYSCSIFPDDHYFVSLDSKCENRFIVNSQPIGYTAK